MLCIHEGGRSHNVVPRRTNHSRQMDDGTKLSVPGSPARTNYPDGRRWHFEPGHCPHSQDFSTHCATLAATLFGPSASWIGKGRPSSRPHSTDFLSQGERCHPCNVALHPSQRDPLECAQLGQGARPQQRHDSSHLEATQLEAPSDRNIPAQPRQTVRRKTPRCRRPLLEPSRQSIGALRRREKPDSSSGSNATSVAIEARYPSPPKSRLQAPRNHHPFRSPQHARRQGHRRLHAAPPVSGIYSVSPTHQRPDATRSGPTPDRRQLWDAQTSPRPFVAETPPPISPAFHPHLQLLAQSGGTMVSGNHRQTDSSRLVPERPVLSGGHQAVHRYAQSKSQSFHLERFCRPDHE